MGKKKKKKKEIDFHEDYVLSEKKTNDNEYGRQKQNKNEDVKIVKLKKITSNNNVKKEENTIEKEDEKLKMIKVKSIEGNKDNLKEKDSTNKKKNNIEDKEFLENNFEQEKRKAKKDSFIIKSKNRKRIVVQEYVDYILKNEKIIYVNNNLYIYDKKTGHYKILTKHGCEVLISQYIRPEHKRVVIDYDIGAIYRLIKIQPEIQMDSSKIDINDMLINCRNRVIDIEKKEYYKHKSDYFFFNCVNAEFSQKYNKEDFKKTNFNKFINNITNKNKQLKELIQEIMGYSVSLMNNAKKFFIFYGVPNSGKSTLIDLLDYIVGEENTSHIPLHKLSDDKYCAELFGKLLNTYNELPDEGLTDLSQIKALVSANDKITARKLYSEPFSFKNRSTLIFATNTMPEIKTKLYQDSSALMNRMIIVPFLNSIEESMQDKYLFEKLKKERNLIFQWSLIGLERFIENDFRFSECDISTKFMNEYKNDEDLINSFINERVIYTEGEYTFWESLKNEFELFAKENEKKAINAKEFKYLKKSIELRFEECAKKIHRDGYNKLGFNNITLK